MDGFVNLHNHSEYSLLDGFSHVDEYIHRAWSLGQDAVGLTDHGNLHGVYQLVSRALASSHVADGNGRPQEPVYVKPIPGVEAYMAPLNPLGAKVRKPVYYGTPSQRHTDVSARGSYLHLTLLAQNDTGWHNLIKLVTAGSTPETFRQHPRIDMDMLARYADGLIAFTGCPSGEIATRFRLGQDDKAYEYARRMKDLFPGRYYVEVMNHRMKSDIERVVLGKLRRMSDDLSIPLVVTNDCHYAMPEDAKHQEEMLAAQSNASMLDAATYDGGPRFAFDSHQYYMKSADDMLKLFPESEWPNAVADAIAIRDGVHVNPDDDMSGRIADGLAAAVMTGSGVADDVVSLVSMLGERMTGEDILRRCADAGVAEGGADASTVGQRALALFAPDDGIDIKLRHDLRPVVPVPEGETEESMFQKQINAGFKRKYVDEKADPAIMVEAKKRIAHEYPVFANNNFIQYMLVVADYINKAREMGVSVGRGRGSAGGSIIAYLMDIVRVDPIKNNLIFERFLNPERLSPPDVDTDFASSRKNDVLQYVQRKYGNDKISNVIVFTTFKPRTAWSDMARIYRIPIYESNRVKGLIPEEKDMTLASLFDRNSKFYDKAADFREAVKAYPQVLEAALAIEGRVKTTTIHPCAVIMADVPISDVAPLAWRPKPKDPWGDWYTQWTYQECEALGLIKMDFLSLIDLDIISWTVANIKKTRGIDISMEDVVKNMDDKPTYDMLGRGDTLGVFQMGSSNFQDLMIRMKPTRFDDISAGVALYRPGPMDMGAHIAYADAKNGRIKPELLDPSFKDTAIDRILAPTYQKIVYQEQVMQISQQAAGFTMGQADVLRKAMGHKKPETMAAMRTKFVNGCVANGYERGAVEKLWGFIEEFSAYAFNKAHSAAYGQVSYMTAWLKCHYPAEFMSAFMSAHIKEKSKLAEFVDDCGAIGLKVSGIDINESEGKMTPVRKTAPDSPDIVFGLEGLNGISGKLSADIVAYRQRHGRFASLDDFMRNAPDGLINAATLTTLANVGAFDGLGVNRRALATSAAEVVAFYKDVSRNATRGQRSIFDVMGSNDHDVYQFPDLEDWSFIDKLKTEKTIAGTYVSARPLQNVGRGMSYLRAASNIPIIAADDLSRATGRGTFRTLAFLTGIERRTSRKGTPFYRLNIDGDETSTPAMIFGGQVDAIEQSDANLVDGSLYLVSGKYYNGYNDRMTYSIESVTPMELARDGRMPLWVRLTEASAEAAEKIIKRELARHPGDLPVFFSVKLHDGTIDNHYSGLSISDDDESIMELEDAIGSKRMGVWE
jgi:DNA polymerase-3 subunit alpha